MKNHTQHPVETLFPDTFLEIKIESGSIVQRFIHFVFIVCQVEDYQNILKLNCRLLAFITNKAFIKNKKESGSSLHVSFSARFLEKSIFSCYILMKFPDEISFSGCCYFMRYWAIYVLQFFFNQAVMLQML